ncbi:hypothetical protein HF998_01990 [Cellulomonas hominis]|uniref:Uncharacterized protein n=1 Tax=Cellulomonas hominis TaxID=156981 RepID=A0A7W8WBN9_9CELL|nr:hypothetical protein [Cellulomonas hominis]MBB5474692.1 hypothetical protein [Cellulomonas hominis]NKY05757.1 hypothetical protein [Cellulomonas hominis]
MSEHPIAAWIDRAEERFVRGARQRPQSVASTPQGPEVHWCGWVRGLQSDLETVPLPWRVLRIPGGNYLAGVMDSRDQRRLTAASLTAVRRKIAVEHARDQILAARGEGPAYLRRRR